MLVFINILVSFSARLAVLLPSVDSLYQPLSLQPLFVVCCHTVRQGTAGQ